MVSEMVRLGISIDLLLGVDSLVNVGLVGVALSRCDFDLACCRSFPQPKKEATPYAMIIRAVRLACLQDHSI